ncbi:hypothetical protein NN3_29070 [Nocardia neocaledoniensis NBRC 108232]|uniref:Uncharacterized protein n=1 Tax=Nocardia neocaledoniensis TaxID=236511 RepID=A0A317N4L9_9NOCA|nr:hypothetical protein [Nocardia neocaledoniensis]PWV70206.1 hypothetical protein DFR69_114173 [Nocardia neocaledoniensis]GEM31900.1 hypothetical protein NN3_29070 [Nocardia neocaledoniensis NBRC 108232]
MVEQLNVGSAKEGIGRTVDGLGKAARTASTQFAGQVGNVKVAAKGRVEKLTVKKPDPYEAAVAEYNAVFTAMADRGLSLLRQRERSTDLIELVEHLVNSIANTPKSFDTDFEEIEVHRQRFLHAEEFAQKELEAARLSAAGAGAGFAAGTAVAGLAPSAAMWVATTFGTASTGTAISTLSGAAASQAALAWLGGGALAAGGGGTAAGSTLLALAGPIGWTIAGATLLASIALFAKKKFENREAKNAALTAIKRNTALVKGMDAQIEDLLERTTSLREGLVKGYGQALVHFRADFQALAPAERSTLAALVNNTKSCAAMLSMRIEQSADSE